MVGRRLWVFLVGVLVVLVGAALAVAGCGGDDDDDGSEGAESSEQESFLFTQSAQQAILDRDRGTLTLIGASPSVTYFSDRPERTAGQTSFAALREDWDGLFGDDPPNAAVQQLGSPRGSPPATVELLAAPEHEGGTTVGYRVRPFNAPEGTPSRVRFDDVALFIDTGAGDGCLSCLGAEGDAGSPIGHCTPIDPRCATATEDTAGCNWGGECGAGADADRSCNPFTDPRCAGTGARPVGNRSAGSGPGGGPDCTVTDPRC